VRRLAGVICCALVLVPGAPAAGKLVIAGRGWGHGVGMSQWGAEGYAVHGWSYPRILEHYYPGTELRREAPVTVRVLVAERRDAVTIGSKAPYRVVDSAGRSRVLPAGRRRIRSLRRPLRFVPGAEPLSLDGAGYRGELLVRPGLNVVDVLPLERYLRGVVPWEMPHRWAPEALRAQAVAARSYALATLKHGQPFDLYADTRDQVYGGIRAEERATNVAVGATAGEVLTWDGRPALTYYFSTSGGRTAAAGDSLPWAPRVPYLRSVADPYDALSPHHAWRVAFARPRIARLLGLPGLRRIELERNDSGRVAEVRVRWRGGSAAIPGRTFQHRLGLPSTWFSIRGAPTLHMGTHVYGQRRTTLLRGWIVVAASVPEGDGIAVARAEAQRLNGHVLRSSDYAALNPGYYVVYRGPFSTRARAEAAAGGGTYVRSLRGR